MRLACPICRRVLEEVPDDFPERPFCSARCRLVDLSHWLEGSYCLSESPEETRDELRGGGTESGRKGEAN